MLVRVPRGSAEVRPAQRQESEDFEAALRRDLASASIISYDRVTGGWSKRVLDLALTLVTLPVWLLVLAWTALRARLRNRNGAVFVATDCIGYGGRSFRCISLANHGATAMRDEQTEPTMIERLPRLYNVLRGDMSLVGPSPVSASDIESMKSAKRYYLSARPGFIQIDRGSAKEGESRLKGYSRSWSLLADVALIIDGIGHERDERAHDGSQVKVAPPLTEGAEHQPTL